MKRVIYKRNRTLSCKVDLTTVSYFSKVISFANKIELSSSFTNKNKLFISKFL